jgi:hypothetical protein
MSDNNFIKKSSIPLPGGGDTHIHPWDKNPNNFDITTRIPGCGNGTLSIHDNPIKGTTFNWEPKKP